MGRSHFPWNCRDPFGMLLAPSPPAPAWPSPAALPRGHWWELPHPKEPPRGAGGPSQPPSLTQVLDSLSCRQMAPVSPSPLAPWHLMAGRGRCKESTGLVSVPCWGVFGDSPAPPGSPTLTSGPVLAVDRAVLAAGSGGCSGVVTELVLATVGTEVCVLSLGCVPGGLWVVETPGLPCGSRGVPGSDAGAGLGWELVPSCPRSSDDVGLVATDPAVASAGRKCKEKGTGEL